MVSDVAEDYGYLRLGAGLDLLENWAHSSGQVEKNAVYKALFAVADGSVFVTHTILGDASPTGEFYVLVRDNLVVKICLADFDTFGISYVGPLDTAPDLDPGLDQVA